MVWKWSVSPVLQRQFPRLLTPHPPPILCIDQRIPVPSVPNVGILQSVALQKELEALSTIDLPAQHSKLLT